MRRADRLFQIVQHLRGRRLTTAAQLSDWLETSTRTIYRDIRDLSLSGVPIEGEAGVGYRLAKGFDIPPIMFDFDEIQALTVGLRFVQSWAGPQLSAAGFALSASTSGEASGASSPGVNPETTSATSASTAFDQSTPPQNNSDKIPARLSMII